MLALTSSSLAVSAEAELKTLATLIDRFDNKDTSLVPAGWTIHDNDHDDDKFMCVSLQNEPVHLETNLVAEIRQSGTSLWQQCTEFVDVLNDPIGLFGIPKTGDDLIKFVAGPVKPLKGATGCQVLVTRKETNQSRLYRLQVLPNYDNVIASALVFGSAKDDPSNLEQVAKSILVTVANN